VKEKRQRVLPDSLSFAKLSPLDLEDSDSDDDGDRATAEQADSSFVVDSPMKPAPKGGAFKLLFEGGAGDVNSQDGRARSQRVAVNTGLGIPRSQSQRATSMSKFFASEMPSDNHQNLKMKAPEGNSTKESAKSQTTKPLYSNRFGNNTFGAAQPSKAPLPEPEQAKQAVHMEEGPQRITAAKRSLADTDSDAPDSLCPNHSPLLLPPSPPPAASSSVYTGKGKGRGQTTGPIRKRPKLPEDSGDEDEGSTDPHVKIREWSWQRRGTSRDTPVEELDPIIGLGAHDRLSSPGTPSDDAPGDFEVNLPDDLLCLLAISPSKAHATRDIGMVRGVLYGERTSNYDAQKGGDIWDVGEIGEDGDSQAEDDWEGEPVPWEAGEL
jgi:hypothetical protein